MYTTKASAVIIATDFNDYSRISTNLIIVDDAYNGFAVMLQNFNESRNDIVNHKHSSIEESAPLKNVM